MTKVGCLGFAILVFAAASGCTPLRSTVPPPYPLHDREVSAEEIVGIADQNCEALRGSRVNFPAHEFTTDGCSAWPDSDWRSCCIEHDFIYWCGGTKEQREVADRQFRSCIVEHSNGFNGWLMFWGVRAGGLRLGPFPWRWGYGHEWPFKEQESQSKDP